MGRLNALRSFVRREVDGIHTSDVEVDPGGDQIATVEHASAPGDDAHPLTIDTVVTVERQGAGREVAVGYLDTKLEPKTAPGEKRIYARKSDGTLACALWLKNDGNIVFEDAAGTVVARIAPDGTNHVGAETGVAALARADKVDAEINRIWSVLTGWSVVLGDGGGALKTAAAGAVSSVVSTAADKARGT